MSRPAAAVHRVIKAYDVRGLVGTEIDESFVHDLGAAFARLMRGEGARQVAIGYDMRDSSPSLAAAFADGVTGQGLDVVRIGLASTDQLYFASGLLDCPGRDVHREPQPGRLQRHQVVPGRRQTGRCRHRADHHQRRPHRRRRHRQRHRRNRDRQGCAGRVRRLPSLAGRHRRSAASAGGSRRGQRDGGPHCACRARCDRLAHGAAAVLRTRRLVSQPRGQPAGPGEPCRPAGLRARHRCRYRAGLRRRCRPVLRHRRARPAGVAVDGDRAGRRPGVGPRDRRDGDPQPDHVTGGPGVGRRTWRHAGAVTGRALLHQGADGRDRRDFRRRAFGALLLPRLLGSRLGNAGRACMCWPRSATSRARCPS